jgi:bacillopeptidase F (M6 metalloprotease family)
MLDSLVGRGDAPLLKLRVPGATRSAAGWVTAEKHGRKWIGIELNPEIAELARHRIAAERAKPDMGKAKNTSNSGDLPVAA